MKTITVTIDPTQDIGGYVSLCTVGFLNPWTGQSLGSGTLARYGQLMGVVTCAHSLRAMEDLNLSRVGFLCFPVRPQRQTWTVERRLTDCVSIYSELADWKGPDIAFLRLPETTALQMESIATFVNLENQQAKWQRPFASATVDAVSGIVAERSDEPLRELPKVVTTLEIGGLLNIGTVASRSPLRGQDRLYFRPRPGPEFVLPTSYGGTRGAGVWRVGLSDVSTEENKALDRRLIGVAYYQTKQHNAKRPRRIICNGPTGIYVDLLAKIHEKWPDECPVPGAGCT